VNLCKSSPLNPESVLTNSMHSKGTLDTSWTEEERKQKKALTTEFWGGYRCQTFYTVYIDERGHPIQRGLDGISEYVQYV